MTGTLEVAFAIARPGAAIALAILVGLRSGVVTDGRRHPGPDFFFFFEPELFADLSEVTSGSLAKLRNSWDSAFGGVVAVGESTKPPAGTPL